MGSVVPVWPLAFVCLIPEFRDGCQQREAISGHTGLCEALGFRMSVARVVSSQTGHIWEYNYREARVAGGGRGPGHKEPAL